jgi:hypothetical protein
MLGDYVPFNFCNRSVMLYVLHRGHAGYRSGQRPIVHLVSTVKRAIRSGRPWAFTDRHADLRYARYFEYAEHLDKVDWSVMPVRRWGGNGQLKEKRQAEFLVHQWFPWACVHKIGVYNRQIAARVEEILISAEHKPSVKVELSWYYEQSNG